MTKSKKMIIGTLPFVALIVLFAIFCGIVSSKGYRLDMYIKIVFNEGIVLSIVATGAIFIYTLGSFDISLGAATLFAATLGVMTYNATENIGWMILVIMLAGIGCSLLNSVLASIFHIPVFVTTVAMMSVLSAIASQIITTKGGAVGGISIPSAVVKSLDTSVFKVIVLVVWVAICIFIFNYTKFGRREKFVGGNPVCAQLSGIKYNNYAILGFLMAGIGVGIGAFIPNPMHVYRVAGVLSGLGLAYDGSTEEDEVVGKLFANQGVDASKISGDIKIVSYLQGYGDTTTDELNAAIQAAPDAFISVGMATTFFTQQLNAAGIEFSDIDSFTKSNGEAISEGKLVYLAGKYSSSVGPAFALVMNAVNGNVIRDAEGNAVSISQNYQVATDEATFDEFFKTDNGDNPIYNKETLDTIIGDSVTCDDITKLVESK